jgi:hypothetical protein
MAVTSCTHNTTLVSPDSADEQIIYALPEKEAFSIAVRAFAEVLPKQSLYDFTEDGRRGYRSTWRFGLDTYSQKVLVVPAIGIDRQGHQVRGYWFDVSGAGSAIVSGSVKNRALYEKIREALAATGAGIPVTGLQLGRYETDGRAYRADGRDARDVAAGKRPTSGDAADQLRELKMMHDQGLITEEEYLGKRRAILDRL